MSSKSPSCNAAMSMTDVKLLTSPKTVVALSELQISGGGGISSFIDGKSADNPVDDHEHPCVCDLRLPRKALTNAERFARFKDWSCSKITKRSGTRTSPGRRVVSPTGDVSTRGRSPVRKSPKKRKKVASTASSASSSVVSMKKDRKQGRIDWAKRPKIAVKMNRTTALRLELGSTYCGKQRISRKKEIGGRAAIVQTEGGEVKKKRKKPKADKDCEYLKCKRIAQV